MIILPAVIADPLHAERVIEANARIVETELISTRCVLATIPAAPAFTATFIRQPQLVKLTFLLTEFRALRHDVPA